MSIKYNGKTVAGNYKISASTTASDTKAGPIKIATEQELKDTTNNKVAVTPYLLNKALSGVNRGLKIGRIGIGFINESQQQERYLNGQVIIQDQFESFATWVKDLIKLYPNLSCTNEEFENACTLSAFGQCGKFVVDDSAGSIRLPKVVNVQGLFDLTQAGLTVEAGLPNITGQFMFGCGTENNITSSGAFYQNGAGGAYSAGHDIGSSNPVVAFSASRSNPIYGNSTTVQQEAVQYPYWIQVATGVETSVDVTRELELNIPFSLLDYKFSEYELNNLSWLRSNGQYNSKASHPAVYELLLKIYNGTETKAGVSVKLSTETFTDYDFVLNAAEETFRLPIKVKLASGKAVVGNGNSMILTDGTASIGFVENGYDSFNGSQAVVAGTPVGTQYSSAGTGFADYRSLGLATSGDTGIETSDSGLYLYFYVGETVQNANLINAGRIEEKVASLIPDNSSLISGYGMPSDKYADLTLGVNGTSYTAPANGYYFLAKASTATGQGASIMIKGTIDNGKTLYGMEYTSSSSGMNMKYTWAVQKGSITTINYTLAGATNAFRFIYAVGSESEAQ